MKKYSCVLMDADRTLFDFDRAQEESLKVTLRDLLTAHEQQFTPELLREYRAISNTLWGLYERGGITQPKLQRERFRILLEKLGIPGGDDLADSCNRRFVEQLGEEACLIDGAVTLCRTLAERGLALYIVTNGIERSQLRRLEKSELRPYIRKMYISEAIGVPKPHREFFDFVFSEIGEERRPSSIVMGDSLTTDIAGGNNAGIDTCWYNPSGMENPGVPCTWEIARLTDFLDLDGIRQES